MARWELTDKHYIHGNWPGEDKNSWQFTETNMETGRVARKLFTVPAFLEKGIIVSQGERHPREFEFLGPPTPEMLPLDDDAEAISAQHRSKWMAPMDGFPTQGPGGFNDAVLQRLTDALDNISRNQPIQQQTAVPVGSVSRAEFELLQAQLLEVQAQLLKAGPQVDEEEPLQEVEPTTAELAKSEAEARAERRA